MRRNRPGTHNASLPWLRSGERIETMCSLHALAPAAYVSPGSGQGSGLKLAKSLFSASIVPVSPGSGQGSGLKHGRHGRSDTPCESPLAPVRERIETSMPLNWCPRSLCLPWLRSGERIETTGSKRGCWHDLESPLAPVRERIETSMPLNWCPRSLCLPWLRSGERIETTGSKRGCWHDLESPLAPVRGAD